MIFSLIKHARPLNPFPVVSVTTTHAMKIYSSTSLVQSTQRGQMLSTILPECAILVVLQDMLMNKSPHVPSPVNLLDICNIVSLNYTWNCTYRSLIRFRSFSRPRVHNIRSESISDIFDTVFRFWPLTLWHGQIKYMWTLYYKCYEWNWLTMYRVFTRQSLYYRR